ncbi:hypothetical protein CEXT_382131 [Caerostris extrusa]|uniref:Uncharacterized protein n=1 Tax=Caerostris extrusa TaxID=172846 RepID=A0AAV4VHE7_CAEEX|nr:hypothetical protein CEXT_382131 [Caerostris extrusa]
MVLRRFDYVFRGTFCPEVHYKRFTGPKKMTTTVSVRMELWGAAGVGLCVVYFGTIMSTADVERLSTVATRPKLKTKNITSQLKARRVPPRSRV